MTARWFEVDDQKRRRGKHWNEKVAMGPGLQRVQVVGGSAAPEMWVLVNRGFRKSFTFPDLKNDDVYDGSQMMFSSNDREHLVVETVRILRWDSRTPPGEMDPDPALDQLQLYDGRLLAGTLIELTPESVRWQEPKDSAVRTFPRVDVFEMTFASAEKPDSGKTLPDLQKLYTGYPGDVLSVRDTTVEAGIVQGDLSYSPDRLQLPLGHLQVWNISGQAGAGEEK
jgi:hypothetical protein